MIMTILAILLILALLGGGWGYPRYGAWGWSPLGLILLIILILYLTGTPL